MAQEFSYGGQAVIEGVMMRGSRLLVWLPPSGRCTALEAEDLFPEPAALTLVGTGLADPKGRAEVRRRVRNPGVLFLAL